MRERLKRHLCASLWQVLQLHLRISHSSSFGLESERLKKTRKDWERLGETRRDSERRRETRVTRVTRAKRVLDLHGADAAQLVLLRQHGPKALQQRVQALPRLLLDSDRKMQNRRNSQGIGHGPWKDGKMEREGKGRKEMEREGKGSQNERPLEGGPAVSQRPNFSNVKQAHILGLPAMTGSLSGDKSGKGIRILA